MKPNLSLYLIADPDVPTRLPFLQTIEEAIKGGVTVVQLRAKKGTQEEFLKLARAIRSLTSKYYIPFIVNDNVQLVQKVDADGVHLGQDDMSIEEARKILGPLKIIGLSTHTPEEARAAETKGVDYIAAGTVFPTMSKDDIVGIIGIRGLQEIRKSTTLPLVGIGGIDIANAASVMETGTNGVAVISAIMKSYDPTKVAQRFRLIIDHSKI